MNISELTLETLIDTCGQAVRLSVDEPLGPRDIAITVQRKNCMLHAEVQVNCVVAHRGVYHSYRNGDEEHKDLGRFCPYWVVMLTHPECQINLVGQL